MNKMEIKKPNPKDKPLDACIRNGVLTISIGIDTLAFAYSENFHNTFPDTKIEVNFVDKFGFAKDVIHEMTYEDEAGNSPLTKFLDEMMDEAINQGSTGIDFPETRNKHGRANRI